MKKKIDKGEKICWACKRTLVEESKLGLCPDCLNKYGTPAVAIGLIFLGRKALKNGVKIAKGAFDVIKHIKG